MRAEENILEGSLTIQAALQSGWREIHEVLIVEQKRNDRRLQRLQRQAEAAGISVSYCSRSAIQQLASGDSHGGVLARTGERRFCRLEELLPAERAAFIVMLDGIEDPYNFAGAARALYAAGADGIVLRPRNWTSASAIVGRASAGAIERLPLAIAESASAAAAFFRAQGLTVAAAAKSDRALSIYQADLSLPLFLLIGGERRGVTRSFLQTVDLQLLIPYGRDFGPSLGTVGAAAVIAFEVMRQRSSS